jgi:hypothetical protein
VSRFGQSCLKKELLRNRAEVDRAVWKSGRLSKAQNDEAMVGCSGPPHPAKKADEERFQIATPVELRPHYRRSANGHSLS